MFYIDRFYAWYKYNLTLEAGIANGWGAVTATDESNILINNDVLDVFFDNTKTSSARQGDNIILRRRDGVYPQVTVTSGGGGLGFYYAGIGYTVETGVSGVTPSDITDFKNAVFTEVMEDSETFAEQIRLMRAEAAGKLAVSGSTVNIRDAADTKNRISATVDANGQRTAVTTDGS